MAHSESVIGADQARKLLVHLTNELLLRVRLLAVVLLPLAHASILLPNNIVLNSHFVSLIVDIRIEHVYIHNLVLVILTFVLDLALKFVV